MLCGGQKGVRQAASPEARGIAVYQANPESRSLDQVVTSQPISIMVLMQSSGKYDIHCKMFSSERAASSALTRSSAGIAASDGSAGPSTKSCCCTRVSGSIDLLRVGL